MSDFKFVKYVLLVFATLIVAIAAFNYVVDPFNFYKSGMVDIRKTQEVNQLRLSKAIYLKNIKPVSIILGSSRAEFGYDPEHRYFSQPAYNLATGGSSMYELTKYLEFAIEQGRLNNVLLVADYINFNSNEQQKVADFNEYFGDKNLYSYLLSLNTLKNSVLTLYGDRQKKVTIYEKNGQREKLHNSVNLRNFGGQLKKIYAQSTYFDGFDNNNHYRDTQNSSFDDFRKFLELCYRNNIKLDIVFGPNHILHWEALDHSIGMDKWYQWKKDVVSMTNEVATTLGATSYKIYDFAIYNEFTSEELPKSKKDEMIFHWELNHYKSELGDMVLDTLMDRNDKLGVQLTASNADDHLKIQSALREKYVDIRRYRDIVLKNRQKVDLNQFLTINSNQ